MATILLVFIYIFYIGLGVPDSLLGAAWPAIYSELSVPVSYASFISSIISCGTVFSSLFSTRVIAKLGTPRVTVLSTSLTAIALLGFSCSHNFLWLCICGIPLGIGAGSIDTALNNYVALHYTSMQINFLHCFYGVGVTISPYLMSLALSDNMNWRGGYRTVFFIQLTIAALSVISLPIWKKVKQALPQEEPIRVLSLSQMLRRRKIWASCGVFLGISSLESTCLIWGSTYLSESVGMSADVAAALITFYFIGMTVGRLLSGLLTIKYSDWQIIFSGQAVIFVAIILLLMQTNAIITALGLFLIGLGNGPVFPNITHLTPGLYSKETSQSIIGIEMAFSNLSIMLTPILFGVVTTYTGVAIFPKFLLIMFLIMIGCTITLKVGDAKSRTKRQNV
ncbi:MFS transporter [Blautia wexlerae]|uniref:MFS transporter n=2 Tax=Blautia wexlerae TaxID=418240 RepID=UPI000E4DF828|nr:MFS transporter [Blautia wexlerae]RHO20163.1 MFS transporter [Ruminococcus sp. AM18-44]RHO26306.1 MFS transporter [Ruminococcus sp. AM18-15]RHQ35488.1 MFS transporter [Ruminococcus sp. AF25-28AC]RHR99367.1 MFS transporter [Ruminococcus sp. AF14-5]RHS64601.1 MFS transporter [Ruminococcus sp. AM46-18]RHT08463.1 MFS transporter [Ruminococcus sp. AM40-10AC]